MLRRYARRALIFASAVVVLLATTSTSAVASPDAAAHSAPVQPYHIKLPFPAEPDGVNEYVLSQGNHGEFTHCVGGKRCIYGSAYAFDFDMPEGAPVAAAHDGVVVKIEEGFERGGCGAEYANSANYVLIDHEDGTTSNYLHLLKSSVSVEPGDRVSQGEIIAQADSSGYTCNGAGGPDSHLHFQVQLKKANCLVHCQSIPVYFDDLQMGGEALTLYVPYKSGNSFRSSPLLAPVEPVVGRPAVPPNRSSTTNPPFFCLGGTPGPNCAQGGQQPAAPAPDREPEPAIPNADRAPEGPQPDEQEQPEPLDDSSCPNGMVRIGPETDTRSRCAPAGNSNESEEEDSPPQPDEDDGEVRLQVCPPECGPDEDESGSDD